MHRFIFTFLFLLVGSLQAQISQYDNQLIARIAVVNATGCTDTHFDPEVIIRRIKTQENNFFSQTEFDNDLKLLSQDFDRIDPIVESIDNRIHITIKLWPKPMIRAIHLHGNERMKANKLMRELGVTPGSTFDRQSFNKAFHKLKAYYVKKGFFEAQLEYTMEPDPISNELDINICIVEGRAGKIKDIVFVNFLPCEENELLETMITKKYNFFMSWITDEGTYHEEAVQQDQYNILHYLQNRGYADAQVAIEVCEAPEDHRIVIMIIADRGELYTFGDIQFSGNCLFPDEVIRNAFTICEGSPYSPDAIRDSIRSILSIYGRRGYIDADVNYTPKLNEGCRVYDLNFTIEEGAQFRVGMIKVFGNCQTQTTTILHETLLIPGEVFNTDKLQKTEERLQNVGFFKNVNVYAVRAGQENDLCGNYRDVHIEVEETSTGHFGAFAGYSTAEELFAGASLTERNFNIRGLEKVWCEGYRALRGAGEYAHATVKIGQKSRSYAISWTKPYFNDTQWTVGFDLENSDNRYVSKDYQIKASTLNLHAHYQINPFVRFGWHYRLRNTNVDVTHDTPTLLKLEARDKGLISASGIAFTYDSTNRGVNPSQGFKSLFELELAGLGGDQNFLAVAYINNYYYTLPFEGTIKFRADLRFIQMYGNTGFHHEHGFNVLTLPLDERLFLGGENNVRGYRPYRLGPRYNEGDPRGGLSLQLFSVEYQRNIFKKLDAFAFFDAGHLSLHEWHFGRLSTSVGYGIRFKVFDSGPPLTLGMGYPINARGSSEVKRFFLTVGGKF